MSVTGRYLECIKREDYDYPWIAWQAWQFLASLAHVMREVTPTDKITNEQDNYPDYSLALSSINTDR